MTATYSLVQGLLKDLGEQGFEPPAEAARIILARAAVAQASDLSRAAAALESAIESGDDAAAVEALHGYSAARGAGDAFHHADSGAASALKSALTPSAFEFARERYNRAAGSFMRAVKKVDPEADPDALDGKQFSVWKSIPGLVRELDLAAKLLGDVARTLHGIGASRKAPASALGLYCPEGAHSDPLSAIWVSPPRGTRGGIWGALVAAGAVLRAPASHVEHSARFDAVQPEEEVPVNRNRTGGAPSGAALTPPAGYTEAAVEASTPPDAGDDYDAVGFESAVRPR